MLAASAYYARLVSPTPKSSCLQITISSRLQSPQVENILAVYSQLWRNAIRLFCLLQLQPRTYSHLKHNQHRQ